MEEEVEYEWNSEDEAPQKFNVNENTEEQRQLVTQSLQQLYEETKVERKISFRRAVIGDWISQQNESQVVYNKNGKFNKTMGYSQKGTIYLNVVETVYLVDIGIMELYQNGMPLSLQQAYNLLLNSGYSMSNYRVYVHLKKLGYVVFVKSINFESLAPPVCFHIWRPEGTKHFRKTNPGIPDYHVVVVPFDGNFPSGLVLDKLKTTSAPVPVIVCVENMGNLNFMVLKDPKAPEEAHLKQWEKINDFSTGSTYPTSLNDTMAVVMANVGGGQTSNLGKGKPSNKQVTSQQTAGEETASAAAASSSSSASSSEFKSDAIFKMLGEGVAADNALAAKVNAIFVYNILGEKDNKGKKKTWTVSLKKDEPSSVYTGTPKEGKKADVTIDVSDEDYIGLATGKASAQALYMKGKLKLKGNLQTAMKFDTIIKSIPRPKL